MSDHQPVDDATPTSRLPPPPPPPYRGLTLDARWPEVPISVLQSDPLTSVRTNTTTSVAPAPPIPAFARSRVSRRDRWIMGGACVAIVSAIVALVITSNRSDATNDNAQRVISTSTIPATLPTFPTSSAPTTTGAPRTTVADPSTAFCNEFRKVRIASAVSAVDYVKSFETQVAIVSPSYRADFAAALEYLQGRLAEIGPAHTGQDLWGNPDPFPLDKMARMTVYALKCQ